MTEHQPERDHLVSAIPGTNVPMVKVAAEVLEERVRQDVKWGEQNHPNGTGPDIWLSLDDAGYIRRHGISRSHLAEWAQHRCESAHGYGFGSFEHILTEEWAEAIAESDPARLREELIQVAAVAMAWVEKIDRDVRSAPAAPTAHGGEDIGDELMRRGLSTWGQDGAS